MDEHDKFYQSFLEIQTKLSKVIKNKVIEKEFVPSYIFSEKNLIIVVGQDGLVANVAKYSFYFFNAIIGYITWNDDKKKLNSM